MTTIRTTEKDLSFIIQEGEGYLIEFKESISDNLAREIVAFANSSGGRIFIGVSDDGRIVGVRRSSRLKSQIQDTARNCDPPVSVDTEYLGKVLVVKVQEGADKPYSCRDGFFTRIGPNSQKLRRDEIIEFLKLEGRTRFDEQYCADFRYPRDFSRDCFRNYLQACEIRTTLSKESVLDNLGVATFQDGKAVFKNAGVLMFAKDPQRFHLQAIITCVRFKGSDKVQILDRKDFADDLIANVENAMKWLKTYIPLRYDITGESLKRKEVPEIPYDALREALLNSVLHRDYFERGAMTMVEFYDDRIEITNPGGLVSGMSLKDLGKKSISRNPLLFDLFHRARFVERVGSGIARIRELMKGSRLSPPIFNVDDFFSITFERARDEPVSEPVSEPISEPISEPVKNILGLIERHVKANLKVLEAATGYSRAKVKRYIAKMKKEGLVSFSGSTKTGHYIITKKGKSTLRRNNLRE